MQTPNGIPFSTKCPTSGEQPLGMKEGETLKVQFLQPNNSAMTGILSTFGNIFVEENRVISYKLGAL